jgi:hypothetical protein
MESRVHDLEDRAAASPVAVGAQKFSNLTVDTSAAKTACNVGKRSPVAADSPVKYKKGEPDRVLMPVGKPNRQVLKNFVRNYRKGSFELQGMPDEIRDQLHAYFWSNRWVKSFEHLMKGESTDDDPDLITLAYVNKLIEHLWFLCHYLSTAKTSRDILIALANFASARTDNTLTEMLLEFLSDIFEEIFGFFQVQGPEEHFESLRHLLDNYEAVKQSKVYKKLYQFLLYAIANNLFFEAGYKPDKGMLKRLYKEAKKQDLHMGPDFVHCLLDTIHFLAEKGFQIFKTGRADVLFHDESTYGKWMDEVVKIKMQSEFLSDPEPHGIEPSAWFEDLDTHIEQGYSMVKHAKALGAYEARFLSNYVADLELIKARELSVRHSLKMRPAPLGFLIFGGSSVAKSTFTNVMYYTFAKVMGLKSGEEFKFTRNAHDKYWANFKSYMHTIVLDDIAALHPNLGTLDPSLVEVLQIGNNVPFNPVQAAIEDKGKTPCLARLLLATTNVEKLNLKSYFSCPYAVARRFPIVIHLTPKPELSSDGGVTVDPMKLKNAQTPDNEYPDFWIIKVNKVIPVGNTAKEKSAGKDHGFETIARFTSIVDFLAWYIAEVRKHNVIQSSVSAMNRNMAAIQLHLNEDLSGCGLPMHQCTCTELQGPIEEFEHILSGQFSYSQEKVDAFMSKRLEIIRGSAPAEVVQDFSDNNRILMFKLLILRYLYTVSWHMTFRMLLSMWMFYCCVYHGWVFFSIGAPIIGYASWFLHSRFLYIMAYEQSKDPKVRKLAFSFFGAKVRNFIGSPKFLRNVALVVMGGWVLKKIYDRLSKLHSQMQGGNDVSNTSSLSESIGSDLVVEEVENPNPWIKDQFTLTVHDVTPVTTSMSYDVAKRLVSNNTVHVRIRHPDTVDGERVTKLRDTKWLCLGGQIYVTNCHHLPDMKGKQVYVEVIQHNVEEGVTPNHTLAITEADILRIPAKDLAFVYLRGIPPKRNIHGLLALESFNGRYNGTYIQRKVDGTVECIDVKALKRTEDYSDASFLDHDIEPMPVWFGVCSRPTVRGDCGTALLIESGRGPVLCGLHFLGRDSTVGALRLTYPDYERAVKHFSAWEVQSSIPLLSAKGVSRALEKTVHFKSPLKFIDKGTAIIYGTLAGHRSKMRSRVARSVIADAMEARGYVQTHGPPVLSHWKPKFIALSDMVRPDAKIDTEVLKQATDAFIQDIAAGLSEEQLSEVIVLSNFQALNGIPGVAYVDKMERATSMGMPWQTTKKKFLEEVEPRGSYQHPVRFVPEIMKRVDFIIKRYHDGEMYHPVFCANLKDEPTKFSKIEAKKTRVFAGAPADWSFVVRKFLLTTVRLIQRNRTLFECAPGLNSHSHAWHELYEYLTIFGTDRIIAGDFANYDKSMFASIILEAFRIIEYVCARAGFDENSLKVVRGIAYDTAFPTYYYFGDLVQCFGSNPSGHPLTVIINSLVNSIFMRYCYISLNPKREAVSFKQYINLMTYGDDNIMNVSPGCTWFDHTRLVDAFASIGIEYTMAEKDRASIPFVNISEATFLKRYWRFDPNIGDMICQIEHDSIQKSLITNVSSMSICKEDQAIETVRSALIEYFFYGKEIYEEKVEMFKSIFAECNLEAFVPKEFFLSWDQCLIRYRESKGCL